MLQPKQKNDLGSKCIKPIILVGLFFGGFIFGIFSWGFLLVYFSIEKSRRNLKTLSLADIVEISGVTDCLNSSTVNKAKTEEKKYSKKKQRDRSLEDFTRVIKKEQKTKKEVIFDNNFLNETTNIQKNVGRLNTNRSIWDDYESVIDIMERRNKKIAK